MTKREWIATAVFAVLVVLSAYQCGATKDERALKEAALDSLAASREDRDAISSQLTAVRLFRDLTETQNKGLQRIVDSLDRRARHQSHRADSALAALDSTRRKIPNTTTLVPVALLDDAIAAARRFQAAFQAESIALVVQRDSIKRHDDSVKKVLISLEDSVAGFLEREADRQKPIETGVRAGTDKCGWGPWGLLPCMSRTAALGVGAVGGASAALWGDDAVKAILRLLKRGS